MTCSCVNFQEHEAGQCENESFIFDTRISPQELLVGNERPFVLSHGWKGLN